MSTVTATMPTIGNGSNHNRDTSSWIFRSNTSGLLQRVPCWTAYPPDLDPGVEGRRWHARCCPHRGWGSELCRRMLLLTRSMGIAYILARQEVVFGSFGWLLFYIILILNTVRVRTFSVHLPSVLSVSVEATKTRQHDRQLAVCFSNLPYIQW